MPDDHGEVEHGLLMPFVVCESKGGPYDDGAFCAGFKAGEIWRLLALGLVVPHRDVRAALVPQLIAMHFGYRMEAEPWDEHPDEWSYVTFTR